jgi:hypothetical protein
MQDVSTLVAKSVRYYSQHDETAFFEWLSRIACVGRVKGAGREVAIEVVRRPTDEDLRELCALFFRYKVDMRQLAAFASQDRAWFRDAGMYWHRRVFGPRAPTG